MNTDDGTTRLRTTRLRKVDRKKDSLNFHEFFTEGKPRRTKIEGPRMARMNTDENGRAGPKNRNRRRKEALICLSSRRDKIGASLLRLLPKNFRAALRAVEPDRSAGIRADRGSW